MRLLDRLDALDARFGLGPKSWKPNRLMRWTARHPWLFTFTWVAVMITVELPAQGVGAGLGIVVTVNLIFGHLLARIAQNRVRAWDAADQQTTMEGGASGRP
jgi:hypothetical protein